MSKRSRAAQTRQAAAATLNYATPEAVHEVRITSRPRLFWVLLGSFIVWFAGLWAMYWFTVRARG